MSTTRVAVNGYGVIGKRVADAVLLQPDMELVGVADVAADWRVKAAAGRLHFFAATTDAAAAMAAAGIETHGTLDDLLAKVDVVVDATPKHIAAGNVRRYRDAAVRFVLQGGREARGDGAFVRRPGELRERAGQGEHPRRLMQHHEHRARPRRVAGGGPARPRPRCPHPTGHRPVGIAPRRHHEHDGPRAAHPLPSGA